MPTSRGPRWWRPRTATIPRGSSTRWRARSSSGRCPRRRRRNSSSSPAARRPAARAAARRACGGSPTCCSPRPKRSSAEETTMRGTRRQFLTAALGAAAVPLLPKLAFARALSREPRTDRVVVLVDLAGGNDGLNTVVPFGNDRYHALRPSLRFKKDDLLALDGELGLRRELASLKEQHDRGRLAIVQGVGYPGPDRSHFRSSDIWHSGSLTPETTTTGWIARLCESDGIAAPARTPALMLGSDRVPLLLVGDRGPAPQVESLERLKLPTGPDDAGAPARAAAMKALARSDQRADARIDRSAAAELEFLREASRTTHESAA